MRFRNSSVAVSKGRDFWKMWKSKFEANTHRCVQIDGTSDCETIVVKFAHFFQKVCTPYSADRNAEFRSQFINRRLAYDVPLANTDKPFFQPSYKPCYIEAI